MCFHAHAHTVMMARPCSRIPVLALVLVLVGRTHGGDISSDADGNLIVNSTAGARVFLNDVDVAAQPAALAAIASKISALARPTPYQKIYALGGDNVNSPLDSVEYFDGTAWTTSPRMSLARRALGAAVFGGSLYAIGGDNGDGIYYSSAERFNGASWTSIQSMSRPRGAPAVAVFAGRIFVTGGSGPDPTETAESFDGVSWRAEPSMRFPRSWHALVSFQGFLFAFGGEFSPVVERFNGSVWTQFLQLSSKRWTLGAAILGAHVYVLGGGDGAVWLDTCERFNGTSIERCVKLPEPRNSLAVASDGQYIYAIGAGDGTSSSSSVVRYDGVLPTWVPVANMIMPRGHHAAVFYA